MRLIPTTVLALSVVALEARADVIDADSTPSPPLDGLVDAFETVGVDVLYSHDSAAGEAEPSFGDRPRVAPLIGFKIWSKGDLDLERYSAWLDALDSGPKARTYRSN